MNSKQQRPLKKLLGIRGMGAALTAFVGLIIIYIAFGIINPAVFSGQNMLNLLRSMSKYLLIGIAQSYVLINDNRNGTIPCNCDRTYCLSGSWCGKWISGWKI